MRKILFVILSFSFCLLILLPVAYVIIIVAFHGQVIVNAPKLAEEATKVIAAFVLSITALGISQIGEHLKIRRKAEALSKLMKSTLARELENLSLLSTMPPPDRQADAIEDLRLNRAFYSSIRERLDSLAAIVTEAQQLLLRSDPEAIRLCIGFADMFSEVTVSLSIYSKNPTRENLQRLQGSLQSLRNI